MQAENERFRNDNVNLVAAFREKSRKHQQTQELYDRLKRKEMTAATQSAAFESVEDVIGTVSDRGGMGTLAGSHQTLSTQQAPEQRRLPPFETGLNAPTLSNLHRRQASNHSSGSGGIMPPPPLRRPVGHKANGLDRGKRSSTTLAQSLTALSKSNTVQSSNPPRACRPFARSLADIYKQINWHRQRSVATWNAFSAPIL